MHLLEFDEGMNRARIPKSEVSCTMKNMTHQEFGPMKASKSIPVNNRMKMPGRQL
jgi:hypothetical protein